MIRTYRLGQPEDWLKIPNISMLTHGFINDAIQQATGTILYIYQDKELLAAQDVSADIKKLIEGSRIASSKLLPLKAARYFKPQDLRIMLEHKVLEMLDKNQ